ncbi:MAG: hypothetical protein ACI8UO_004997 [Verrucomicrobiales bacterium]|jgi:hypothetical protein
MDVEIRGEFGFATKILDKGLCTRCEALQKIAAWAAPEYGDSGLRCFGDFARR